MSSHHRPRAFHPYRLWASQRRPVSHPQTFSFSRLDQPRLRQLQNELSASNTAGDIVTFDRERCAWVPWTRPVRHSRRGLITLVAASGFHRIEDLVPPICPHVVDASSEAQEQECRMLCRQMTYQGKTEYVFRAPHHGGCPFIVVIPPLPPRFRYSQSPIPDDDRDSFSETSSVSANLFTLSPGPSSPTTVPTSPTQEPGPTEAHTDDDDTESGYFTKSAANARTHADMTIIEKYAAVESGRPPATVRDDMKHPMLDGYRDVPGRSHSVYSQLLFMDTPVGILIRRFNSTIGISLKAFGTIHGRSIGCPGCHCLFSRDGYEYHIDAGVCRNTPRFPKVPTLENVSHFAIVRSAEVHGSAASLDANEEANEEIHTTVEPQDFLFTIVGRAWLAYNSKIGVPRDVFAFLIGSRVECSECYRVRSYDGDAAHRVGGLHDGPCGEYGQIVQTVYT